jgi:hypothetical protein
MAAPDNTKLQVNFKATDGTLINLYATSREELESLLTAAQDFSALIGSVSQSFGSFTPTAPVYNRAPVAPAALNPLDDRANPPAPSASAGNVCNHGPMKYREGVGDKGPWKGYFCQAPKGATDKCKNIYVR